MVTLPELADQAARLQAHADELTHRFQTLTSFEQAAQFDSDAQATIRLFERYKADLEGLRRSQAHALEDAKARRQNLSLFKRAFTSRGEENSLAASISQADKAVASVEDVTSALYDLIDRTPANKAEQQEMLSELRLLKKEITTEKRSLNEAMRQIRTKARQDMATLTGVGSSGLIGSVVRLNRMSIRHKKEASLAPHENAKTRIERQLIEVEKRINWISRFSGEDPPEEKPPLRCGYCGRRVADSGVCPRCGSDQTTRDL